MTLDELLTEYESDTKINDNKLDHEAIKTAMLHHKYLAILMRFRVRRVQKEANFNESKTMRFKYFRGELSRDDLRDREWEQYQGVKPLKTEMEELLRGDKVLGVLKKELDYLNEMIYALEEILKQVKARDWNIRNAVEFKKLQAGN